ncbi:MAG: glycosyltransferase family 9 protein [Pyrinomonadaceae bacterium]|nr:glycosyltransferase family 9 protein [Pyrinomonadaceae bacterium]
MVFDARNILVIDFGQLGDVVLSLPALRAIRERFPAARITVAVGKPGAALIEFSGVADATIAVDRVALRDGRAPLSLLRIGRLVGSVRRAEFDFVIDLHSLNETNLLGYLSKASLRLYARRPGRSLDFLSNFRPRPPVEDRSKHAVDRYLDVLEPLGIRNASRVARLRPREEDNQAVEQVLKKAKVPEGSLLAGIFPGAGHPSRRWPLERFGEVAERLERNDRVRPLLFAGPEERGLIREMRAAFPHSTVILDRLTIPQLVAALARLSVFVSNDTGPMHIAAAVGTPVVILLGQPAPSAYIPLGDQHRVVCNPNILAITVDEVYAATRSVLSAERTAALFAS